MNLFEARRGELLFAAASLLVFFSTEILQWQFPARAAGEMLCRLVIVLRRGQAALLFVRR